MCCIDISFCESLTMFLYIIIQFKDFLYSYNKLSELCFSDCVWDFTSRTIRDQEVFCVVTF